MRLLLPSVLTVSMTLCAVYPQNSAPPLSLEEKQLLWEQLMELKEARIRIRALEEFVAQNDHQQKLLAEAYQMKLDAQAGINDLRTRERDLALEKAAFYEQAYRAATKKRSKWCTVKRIFTLGLSRCK